MSFSYQKYILEHYGIFNVFWQIAVKLIFRAKQQNVLFFLTWHCMTCVVRKIHQCFVNILVCDGFRLLTFSTVLQSWQTAGSQYLDTDVVVGGLEPDTTYTFLVRARNEHGIGGPSPLSALIRTLGNL